MPYTLPVPDVDFVLRTWRIANRNQGARGEEQRAALLQIIHMYNLLPALLDRALEVN